MKIEQNIFSNAIYSFIIIFILLAAEVHAENQSQKSEFVTSLSTTSPISQEETLQLETPLQENQYTPHRERFDKWASTYDESSFQQWGVFTPAHNLIIEQLGEFPVESKILDVACGTGNLTLRLAEMVPDGKVVGIDFSQEMIAIAQSKVPPKESNVTFIKGNAENLPFPDNSFDYVACSYAFHHFPNPEQAVQEMYRVLKDGGRAFLIDPYKIIPGGILYDWINRTFFEEGTHIYFPKTLKTFFQNAGFKEIKQKRSFRRLHFFVPSMLTMGEAEKDETMSESSILLY